MIGIVGERAIVALIPAIRILACQWIVENGVATGCLGIDALKGGNSRAGLGPGGRGLVGLYLRGCLGLGSERRVHLPGRGRVCIRGRGGIGMDFVWLIDADVVGEA